MTKGSSLQSLPILRQLVGFDTTSRNSNLELMDYVKSYLDDLSIPFLETNEDAQVTQLATEVLGDSTLKKVSYNCEACLFHEAWVPTIICGPGDINQAHKPNEYIEIDQIAKCEAFMQGLMERVCIAT